MTEPTKKQRAKRNQYSKKTVAAIRKFFDPTQRDRPEQPEHMQAWLEIENEEIHKVSSEIAAIKNLGPAVDLLEHGRRKERLAFLRADERVSSQTEDRVAAEPAPQPAPQPVTLVVQQVVVSQVVNVGDRNGDVPVSPAPDVGQGEPAIVEYQPHKSGATDPALRATEQGPRVPFTVPTTESSDERQSRRLDRLQSLGGGRVAKAGGGWKASGKRGALAALAREEVAAGKPYSDVRDVARDLDREADRRRASRAMPRG